MEKSDYVTVNQIKFTLDDINRVVSAFYAKVEVDRYLRGPFNVVSDWPHHIERLTHFWWVRLGGKPYMEASYNPIQKHFETGFSEELLDVWLTLFKEILDKNLTSDQAQLWFSFAQQMGAALNHNNELMKLRYSN